tara:strand:- start:2338 stop:2640 length:303 start_codon:yes stop_codon:yes gene_type:complete
MEQDRREREASVLILACTGCLRAYWTCRACWSLIALPVVRFAGWPGRLAGLAGKLALFRFKLFAWFARTNFFSFFFAALLAWIYAGLRSIWLARSKLFFR